MPSPARSLRSALSSRLLAVLTFLPCSWAAADATSIFDDEYQGAAAPAPAEPAPDEAPAPTDAPADAPVPAPDDPPATEATEPEPQPEGEPAPVPETPAGPARHPVPPPDQQAAAEKRIRAVFQKDLKDKSRPGRRAVASRMIDRAAESADDPAARYALLALARDLAADSGDVRTALRAVDALDAAFLIDAPKARVQALTRSRAGAASKADHAQVAAAGLELIDQLTRTAHYRHLATVAPSVRATATKSGDRVLMATAKLAVAEAEAASAEFERAKEAATRLKAAPKDPAANLSVGRFLCLYRGDWRSGLPRLANGSDAALRDLARLEAAVHSDDDRKALANGWWDLAEAQKTNGRLKRKAQERACAWYGTVLDGLTGLERVLAQKRLDEARANGVDTTARPETTAAGDNAGME